MATFRRHFTIFSKLLRIILGCVRIMGEREVEVLFNSYEDEDDDDDDDDVALSAKKGGVFGGNSMHRCLLPTNTFLLQRPSFIFPLFFLFPFVSANLEHEFRSFRESLYLESPLMMTLLSNVHVYIYVCVYCM